MFLVNEKKTIYFILQMVVNFKKESIVKKNYLNYWKINLY